MTIKVLALASYDSFLNAAKLIGEHFERADCTVDYALVKARKKEQISQYQIDNAGLSKEIAWIDIKDLCNSGAISSYDIILSCLEGASTRRLTHFLDGIPEKRPLTIAIQPGLVLRFPYDGYSMRSGYDLIWFNCQQDLDSYKNMCEAFGVSSDNARLFGVVSLLQKIERLPEAKDGPVIFFEQAIMPKTKTERSFLAWRLLQLALDNPSNLFLVKPRLSKDTISLHTTPYPIRDLLKEESNKLGKWPENLQITDAKIESLLSKASHCLTISSTVAVEALHNKIPTAIISDFGAHDDYGLWYFYNSGLMKNFCELSFPFSFTMNETWSATYLHDPNVEIQSLIEEAIFLSKRNLMKAKYNRKAEFSNEFAQFAISRIGEKRMLSRTFNDKKAIKNIFAYLSHFLK